MVGIALGGAATEGFNVYRGSHDSRIFQERARCAALAAAYVKENSTDSKQDPFAKSWVTVTLDRADYSPARNSCVAELETTYWSSRIITETESVRDLLSGESLFSSKCTEDCIAVRPLYADPAFDYVMKNASEPVELETKWANVHSSMSKDAARSAPTTVTQWDAKGNPVPNSKHPPSSPASNTPPGP